MRHSPTAGENRDDSGVINRSNNISKPVEFPISEQRFPPKEHIGQVYFAPRLMSYVHVGNFVLLVDHKVVCLHWTNSETALKGCMYVPYENAVGFAEHGIQESRVLDSVKEIVKTDTFVTFGNDDVLCHAIVLSPRRLINSGVQGVGIENLFVCRFQQDSHGRFCSKDSNLRSTE